MKWMLCLLLILSGFGTRAQEPESGKQGDTLKFIGLAGKDIIDFEVDNLGAVYLLNKTGQLKKTAPNNDSISVFNDVRRYGKIHSMDVSNPLKVLLYFKDFGSVVVLDRFLSIRNTIDLRKQGIFQAKAVSQSFDNGIWVYDEMNAKLKRLDDNGKLVSETADFRVLTESPPSPVSVFDTDKQVYLYDPGQGLYILDYFGGLVKKIALLQWSDLQVIEGDIFGRKGNLLLKYKTGTRQLEEKHMGEHLTGMEKIKVAAGRLFFLKAGKVYMYSLAN